VTAAGLPVGHGVYEYAKGICRCDDWCRPAWRAYGQRTRRNRIRRTWANGGIAPVSKHNRSTYTNWACGCETCAEAQGAYRTARRVHG
jgi:hypothetical protein